jgi:hypothetical protein
MQLNQVEKAVLSTYSKMPLEVNYLYQKSNFIAISISGKAAKDYPKIRKEQIRKGRKRPIESPQRTNTQKATQSPPRRNPQRLQIFSPRISLPGG